jgi:polyisoprenoid-binding protein YceI
VSTVSETRSALPTGTWQVDRVHSTVEFTVKHMLVANFRGGFDSFEVTADLSVRDDELIVDGELTLKGITRPVTIKGTVSGPVTSFDGSSRLGLELETIVDRTAYGLDWNAPLPTGGFAVGNDVKLHAELELVLVEEA